MLVFTKRNRIIIEIAKNFGKPTYAIDEVAADLCKMARDGLHR